MVVMIVSASEESLGQLAASLALGGDDLLVRASGLMSAVWYGKVFQPELVVIDLWPTDDCTGQAIELLKRTCPQAVLRFVAPTAANTFHA